MFIADLNIDLKIFVIIFNFLVFIILKFFNVFFYDSIHRSICIMRNNNKSIVI